MADGTSAVDVVTAVAAMGAAALSAVTLVVTGRRAELRWRREALIDAFDRFATTSFARSSAATWAMRTRHNHPDEAEWRALVDASVELGRQHSHALTRVRLLARAATVRAAEAQLLADGALEAAAEQSRTPPTAAELDAVTAAWATARHAREQFFDAARRELGLPAGTRIDPRLKRTLTPPPSGPIP